ncbi:recombinase family protein [Streptomyces sp. NPDC017993]|uniref:recombinase family protein n=1 Tax=Streptomyces sp. NPDC017993 TaxID=3365027 RepID=UPI0037B19B7B
MSVERAPLAFIYDRCATRSHQYLDMRLAGCHVYAARHGWVLRGRWLDLGDAALGQDRPQLDSLLEAMRAEAGRREVICLVHNWGRLAHAVEHRIALQQRIARAGGYSATTFDESDQRAREALTGARHA